MTRELQIDELTAPARAIDSKSQIAKWPLFSSVLSLVETIYSLGYVVGRPGQHNEVSGIYNAPLLSTETGLILRGLCIIDFKDKATKKLIQKLQDSYNKTSDNIHASLSRVHIDNRLGVDVVIYQTPTNEDEHISITILQNSENETVIVSSSGKSIEQEGTLDMHGIYKYKPLLDGLKEVVDLRKKFKEYLNPAG